MPPIVYSDCPPLNGEEVEGTHTSLTQTTAHKYLGLFKVLFSAPAPSISGGVKNLTAPRHQKELDWFPASGGGQAKKDGILPPIALPVQGGGQPLIFTLQRDQRLHASFGLQPLDVQDKLKVTLKHTFRCENSMHAIFGDAVGPADNGE